MKYLNNPVLLLFLLVQGSALTGASYSTEVRIAGWNSLGERIPNIGVTLTSREGHKKFEGNGLDVRLSVPTGDYILRVSAPGFESRDQFLRAYQPAVFRSVALPVAWIQGQRKSGLSGTLKNYDGDEQNLRIRLMGLYGDVLWEAKPDAQSAFRFPADAGAYILLVVVDLRKGLSLLESRP
ncbi:MAG: hypothetical protein WA324_00625, partial [Bryobacteraceae bacterium]